MSEAETAADRFAAQDVIIQYAACIDERDLDTYRGCFLADVELFGFLNEPIRGVDAWMEFVQRALSNFESTQHMLGPPRVRLTGDAAEMRTDLTAQHFLREPSGRIFTLWGTYHTRLARTDDGWKIARHELDTRATRTSEPYLT